MPYRPLSPRPAPRLSETQVKFITVQTGEKEEETFKCLCSLSNIVARPPGSRVAFHSCNM